MGKQKDQDEKGPPWRKRWWGWTGFGEKKLWDWLQLLSALAIPVVLALAGFWFTAQQQEHQQEAEEQRAQATALQEYLTQMNQFMLEKNLRNSEEGSEVRTLARAQTLTTLERLDPSRRTQILHFLMEAKLVQSVGNKAPVIGLNGATLSETKLLYANLEGANLIGANLSGADLNQADLSEAHLEIADLSQADLSQADLNEARLFEAKLMETNLSGADLREADLNGANLGDANLSEAYLLGADLSEADLSGVRGVTEERLHEQAKTLEDATMPDGQKMPAEPGPLEPGPIQAGAYVTDQFKPAFRFEVGEGWVALGPAETSDYLLIESRPEGVQLIFTSPRHVFDPSSLSEPKETSAPENAEEWASWFQRHPNLETSNLIPVSVGGVSGVRIDVMARSKLKNYPRDVCGTYVQPGQPCVPLYPQIFSAAGWKDRFVMVDVDGDTVVIDVSAPAEQFDDSLPKAQKILDTVEWKGAQALSSGNDGENSGSS